jgi:hypothetical protein
MMKSVLTEFFNGNIYPNETFTQTPEYRQVNQSILKEMDFWEKALSGDHFKKLEDLQRLMCQSSAIENEQFFSLGFKLGALIMAEVLSSKEDLPGEFKVTL